MDSGDGSLIPNIIQSGSVVYRQVACNVQFWKPCAYGVYFLEFEDEDDWDKQLKMSVNLHGPFCENIPLTYCKFQNVFSFTSCVFWHLLETQIYFVELISSYVFARTLN